MMTSCTLRVSRMIAAFGIAALLVYPFAVETRAEDGAETNRVTSPRDEAFESMELLTEVLLHVRRYYVAPFRKARQASSAGSVCRWECAAVS